MRRYIIILLFLVGSLTVASAEPTITLTQNSRTTRLDRVNYHLCEAPGAAIPLPRDAGGAIGRSYGRLEVHPVVYPNITPHDWSEADAQRGGFFDVWNLFSDGQKTAGHAVLLEFTIRSKVFESCYLSIGFNDCNGVVFIDHRPIWGLGGQREHALGQNFIPIRLKDGQARVSLLLWKLESWTAVPENHFDPEWAANLEVCPTVDAAWKTYLANNYHFLDTPIVNSLRDLRFDVNLKGHRKVVLRNLKGEVVLTGALNPDSTLNLPAHHTVLPTPFVGTITLADEIAEALVVKGKSTIDSIVPTVVAAGQRKVPDWQAWAFRCKHLIKPEFLNDRDRWWARKLALSLVMAGLQTKFDPTVDWIHEWMSARIQFHSYRSAIDGTIQHFRAMIGPPENGHSRPLAIFLPGVPMPIRPSLESYAVADMRETTEQLARLADQYRIDLLWPDDVDIDYGGNYTRKWVDEALHALQEKFPPAGYRPIFVVGACEAGVTALGYAESYWGIDGIALWSPVVSRNVYRWPIRDKSWMPMLPPETLAEEATDTNLIKLKSVPIFCLFDFNVPGHGDRPGTKNLLNSLSNLGGNVSQHWLPDPDRALEWGVRARESEMEWLNWIAWNSPQNGPAVPRKLQAPPQTIKAALLTGFMVDEPSSPTGRAWLDHWRAVMAQYRGASATFGRTNAPCRVQVRRDSDEKLESIFTSEHHQMHALRMNVRNWPGELKKYTDIWIARLETTPHLSVEVRHCCTTGTPAVPGFDLIREGGCKAVAWGFRNGRWELIQVWL